MHLEGARYRFLRLQTESAKSGLWNVPTALLIRSVAKRGGRNCFFVNHDGRRDGVEYISACTSFSTRSRLVNDTSANDDQHSNVALSDSTVGEA